MKSQTPDRSDNQLLSLNLKAIQVLQQLFRNSCWCELTLWWSLPRQFIYHFFNFSTHTIWSSDVREAKDAWRGCRNNWDYFNNFSLFHSNLSFVKEKWRSTIWFHKCVSALAPFVSAFVHAYHAYDGKQYGGVLRCSIHTIICFFYGGPFSDIWMWIYAGVSLLS